MNMNFDFDSYLKLCGLRILPIFQRDRVIVFLLTNVFYKGGIIDVALLWRAEVNSETRALVSARFNNILVGAINPNNLNYLESRYLDQKSIQKALSC